MLAEVRARDEIIKQLQRQKQKKPNTNAIPSSTDSNTVISKQAADSSQLVIPPVLSIESVATAEIETTKPKKPVPYVRVHDYEQLKREAGFL
jgi:putative transposase